MAQKTTITKTNATENGHVDLLRELLAQLKQEGIKPKVRWSPSKKYASLLVEDTNLGYVFKQTSSGIKVKAGVTVKELGRGASRTWQDISHESKVYAALGFFATPAEVRKATAALKLSAHKAHPGPCRASARKGRRMVEPEPVSAVTALRRMVRSRCGHR
jgi:hypothetical protein